MKQNIIKELNEQMNIEFDSANSYLQMSSWCIYKGFEGSHIFLKKHFKEEMQHMQRFFEYLCDVGQQPFMRSIKEPKYKFESLFDIFNQTYENEKNISLKINKLCELVLKEKDYRTFKFLEWYIVEQIEEEKLFKSVLNKTNLLNKHVNELFLFDKELKDMK